MNHKDILESSRIGKWKYSSTHVLKRHLLWRSYTFLIRSYTFREASSLWFCVGSCRPSCSEVIRSYTFLYVPCNPHSKSLQSRPEAIRSYTFRATLSLNAISPAMKLYVPIRSVQPSRNSVKLLYIPIRSYYVPIVASLSSMAIRGVPLWNPCVFTFRGVPRKKIPSVFPFREGVFKYV